MAEAIRLSQWIMAIANGADSEEKREPVSDIDTAVVDNLKVLDPKRPIREADIGQLPAFSLRSTSNSLCSMPNIVDQAPNTTVTRSVVYERVTMYIPQRELWMRPMPPAIPRR